MTTRVDVLGPIRVRDGDDEVHVGGPRQRVLLATLLLHHPGAAPVAELVTAVFGRDPPRRARATLRTYVTRLRRVLPPDVEIVSRASGYAVRLPERDALDATRFEATIAHAERHLDHHEHPAAVERLGEALGLWRGRAFDDVADRSWAAAEVQRLEQRRTRARELLVDALVADDRAADALPVTRELVDGDPYDESQRLRRARTLYRAGRATDALGELRAFRRRLADELGLVASTDLDGLELAMLRHDPGLGGGRPVRGYLVGDRLGSGASGPVHVARRPGSDVEYAIRIYPAELADDPRFIATFVDDVRRAAVRPHPGLVPIHDAWREPGIAYLVMRRLTGTSLAERLRHGPLSREELMALRERVGGAMAAVREVGLRHGRLTTASVLYDDGLPFLTDLAFGERDLRGGDDEADLDALLEAAGTTSRVAPTRPRVNPYVGLRAFEAEDADWFHGRERLVDTLADRVSADDPDHRFTLLVGASGSGKSSLVRAGLVARLRAEPAARWLAAVTQPSSIPFKDLARALRRVAPRSAATVLDQLADGEGSLASAAEALLRPGDRLLVVVDQLEDLFALPDPEVLSYLATLTEAVGADSRIGVVAALRADHYDRPLRLAGLGDLLQRATMVLGPLDREARRRAVLEPARAAGLEVEDEALIALLDEGGDSLPALQYALYDLAERAGQRITAADLAAIGGVDGAIAHQAELLVVAGQHGDGAAALHGLFRHLVGVDRHGEPVRRRVPLRSVLDDPASPEEATVQAWIDARLLSTDRDPDSREPIVQIGHEALLRAWPRLQRYLDDERDWLRQASRARAAAEEWARLGRDDDMLWRGSQLARADDVLGDRETALAEPATSFLARSREVRAAEVEAAAAGERARERTTRQLRRQRGWLAAALVVVVLAAGLAWQLRRDALAAAQRADDRARAATVGLVAAASEARGEDWTRSLLLAVEARRLDDSPATREALLATLSSPSPVPAPLYTAATALVAMAQAPDATRLVTKDADGTVAVLDGDGNLRHDGLATPPSFHRGGLDVSDDLVVSSGTDGAGAVLLDLDTGARVGSVDSGATELPDVAFHPDGTRFAMSGDGRVRIFDTATSEVVRTLAHPGGVPLVSVLWTPDGARLYAGGAEGTVARWDLDVDSAEPAATTTASDLGSPIVDLDLMADGGLLVAATFDTGTLLLHPDELQVVAGPLGADNAVLGVGVDPSGTELAVAASSSVDRWQVFPGRAPVELAPTGGGATATYTGPDELVTGALDGTVATWSLRPELPGLASLDELGVGNPRLDPTGRVLAMWGWGAGVRLHDADTLELLSTLPVDDPERTSFSGIAFDGEGATVATVWCTGPSHVFDAPCDGNVAVHDVATGQVLAGPEPTGQLAPWVSRSITWSGDGRWIATGHVDGSVQVRRADDLALELTLTDLTSTGGFVTEVDFTDDATPTGVLVATVGTDAATWAVPDWDLLARDRVGVTAHFTPDGRLLTSDQDGTVSLRDERLAVLGIHRGLPGPATRPAFTSDGARFATIDDFTGQTRIWRTDPLAPIGGPIGVAGRAGGVTLSPDGTRLVVGGERAWALDLDPDRWEGHACAAARRNLTREEWTTHLGAEPYRQTCPQFPPGS
ncbi:BTAD domain-containing putative transcriptional regulator [Salsipaludibacter albus]|uniref:nSTAND1 domain-containing NTPase n=1 Tax=Salsipaludibacter albus TaxID=2849650 RepID=UPI001EE476FD|nr:BTAD domain-containing putative transcriptional regulator [Salsipaludibacter albus]MBY5163205.1 hypothetical protein [Salsipaludibacter albus]